MLDPAIATSLLLAFATLFAAAALSKLRHRAEFIAAFAAYGLLPRFVRPAAAQGLPFAELAVAAGLIASASRGAAAIAGCCLLLVYACAIAVNLRRGRRDLECGCGGPSAKRLITAWMVWRNCALAGVLALLALPPGTRPLQTEDLITVGGLVTTVMLLYMALDELLGEIAPRSAALRALRGRASR